MLLLIIESSYDSPIVTMGIFSLLGAAVYLMPTMVALLRNHHKKWLIILLNVFAGWTAFGWLAALVWSFLKVENKYPFKRKKHPV